MSDTSQGPGWWQASDGKWYPPGPGSPPPAPPPGTTPPGALPPYQAPYGAPYGGSPANNSNAVIAMVLGIAGLVACGFFTGIPAIFVGNKAKREIRESGGREGGEGMATAGVVLGWISVAFGLIAVVAIVAIALLGEPASDQFVPVDGINTDPADGVCDYDRFMQDPDC